MLHHSANSGCNSLLSPNVFLNRPSLTSGIEINSLLWMGCMGTMRLNTVHSEKVSNGHVDAATAHPFFTMMTIAPRSRMRTARPPAQAPRIRPMSSACWDTSRALLESLQAAAEHDRGRGRRRGGILQSKCESVVIAETRC